MLIKYGFLKKERTQRYKCKKCRRMCSDAPNRIYGTLRTKPEKIIKVLHLLTEGVGVRATGRLVGVHRDTVLRILKHAGQRSYDLLKRKLVDVPVKHVQADEIHTFVLRKSPYNSDPELDMNPWGDYYVFLGLEQETKLLLMPTIGKRTESKTALFANDLKHSTTGRFQLTTDGFRPYKTQMKAALGDRIDFAQFYKEYNMLTAQKRGRFNKTYKDSAHKYVVRCGAPEISRITTAHVERANLSLRTFNRRFNRRTICFSKDEEYLAYSVYLFVAHHNFCRAHGSLGKKQTPAMASGIATAVWPVESLLAKNSL